MQSNYKPNFRPGSFNPAYRGKRNFQSQNRGKYYKLNHNIRAFELRVLDEDNKQVGVMTKEEALQLATQQGVDLVEIAPNATPVVAKLIDFKKYKYEEAKREKEARKKTKETTTKEVWLTPRMAEHDLNVKIARIKEFLEDGDRVKLTVKFTGREMAHTNLGFDVVKRVVASVAELGKPDREPRMEGRRLTAQLAPVRH